MIHRCAACQQKNRVAASHLADVGRCGACKAPIPPLHVPLEVNEQEFSEIIQTAKVPVLVDFWASWCGPCRAAAPEVKKAAESMSGKAIVLKVNTEEQPRLAQKFSIQSIPNFMVFYQGRPVSQKAGLMPASQLASLTLQAA